MSALRVVLGDQLSTNLASLQNANKKKDVILLCEVQDEATYVPHHPQKIAFIFSAMRHFAKQLEKMDFKVRYIKLDDPNNQGSLIEELKRATNELHPESIHLTEPGEYRLLTQFKQLKKSLSIDITIHEDHRFLCSKARFKQWAEQRKILRMEDFYHEMRREYGLLMQENGQEPLTGKWNYDKENRKPVKESLDFPKRIRHQPDDITKAVLTLVKSRFSNHFGDLDGFNLAVTARQAENELDQFINTMLENFGDYQDAMCTDEAFLFHSKLSFYLNAGLLDPLTVCKRAEQAYKDNKAPINAVEGFIRQILGWREFIRGVYWLEMPKYKEQNFFNADRPLPRFYWDANTKMHCLSQVIKQTKAHAYSHHIQRLMVTGNFALIAGLAPNDVCDWYLAVYADAYEWVELPNTLGMALFGDGGRLASKPYAASGKYIHRMSNFCESCDYSPNHTTEEEACPFNALYWHFLKTHEKKLANNPRMRLTYANWHRLGEARQEAILDKAQMLLKKLDSDAL